MLDAQMGGTSPRAYHVANVVWHALATCVVAAVLLSLRYSPRAAGVGALLFASHPALVPAVAWIPHRVSAGLARVREATLEHRH